jgi:hypothetical protein
MITVYIAGPYTLGDVGKNVHNMLKVTDELITLGFCPIAPLLFHYQHIFHPREYEKWMEIDLELVKRSDVLLRLHGKSPGANKEVLIAKRFGIPVVKTITELIDKVGNGNIQRKSRPI